MMDKNTKKKNWLYFFLIFLLVLIFILDRFLKFLAINNYFIGSIKIVGDFFSLNFIKNYNIAFSLPASGTVLNLVIVFIIIGLLYNLVFLLKKQNYKEAFFLTLILGGAISNFTDRLKFGFVVDYFDLKYFTVFNLADIMIVGGVIGLIVLILINKKTLRRSV